MSNTNSVEPCSIRLRVKAVPGSSRDSIADVLGDRLKIRVATPPEDGKANKAIRDVLADALGVRTSDVDLVAGHTNPKKTFEIRGIDQSIINQKLGPQVLDAVIQRTDSSH